MTNYCNLFQRKFVINQNSLNNLQKTKNIICKNSLFYLEQEVTINLMTTSMILLRMDIEIQSMEYWLIITKGEILSL
jgi:hypothetical protein